MMNSEILMHPKTEQFVVTYIKNPSQSLMLSAPKGFGKQTFSSYLVDKATQNRKEFQFHVYPGETGIVQIENIRAIKDFVRLRTNNKNSKRFIVIHSADTMNEEAQNALLKVLEEPPENCHIILTVESTDLLLPTIISRVTEYQLSIPTKEQCFQYFSNYDKKSVENALALSNGLPGLTASLVKGEASSFIESIALAKKILTSKLDDKLEYVEKLSKNKVEAQLLVQSLMLIATSAVHASVTASKNPLRWKPRIELIAEAEDLLMKNVSTKLVLTRLFASI